MTPVQRYRMFVEVRTDLTDEEIAQRLASQGSATSPTAWPFRDTGEIIHARRRNTATAFYRALKQISPLIKIRAVRINEKRFARRNDDIAMRAWRGFDCVSGSVNGADDDIKHFDVARGVTACGINYDAYWPCHGKPECNKCLAVAVEKHPEMKQYL